MDESSDVPFVEPIPFGPMRGEDFLSRTRPIERETRTESERYPKRKRKAPKKPGKKNAGISR